MHDLINHEGILLFCQYTWLYQLLKFWTIPRLLVNRSYLEPLPSASPLPKTTPKYSQSPGEGHNSRLLGPLPHFGWCLLWLASTRCFVCCTRCHVFQISPLILGSRAFSHLTGIANKLMGGFYGLSSSSKCTQYMWHVWHVCTPWYLCLH